MDIFASRIGFWWAIVIAALLAAPASAQDPPPTFDPTSETEIDFGAELEELEDLLNQQGVDGFPTVDQPELSAGAKLMFIGLAVVGAVVGLLLGAIVAHLLSSALNAVPLEYRKIPAWLPWLLLIPVVNVVVVFLAFVLTPQSLREYLESQGDTSQGDCGGQMGLIGAILSVIPCIPLVGPILLIIALVKISQAKRQALTLAR